MLWSSDSRQNLEPPKQNHSSIVIIKVRRRAKIRVSFFAVNSYITYFGYAQLCGIIVGPFIGLLFDRNSINCCRKYALEDSSSPIVEKSAGLRVRRIEESVVPFLLTNIFCLMLSLLSLSPWRWGLVSPCFSLVTNKIQ